MNKDGIPQFLITVKYKRKEYKKAYMLRSRIGMRILQFIGVLEIDLTD